MFIIVMKFLVSVGKIATTASVVMETLAGGATEMC